MENILEKLGIVGWKHLEAPIIAALATEANLLLIGDHGTGKSMLLEQLANALDLEFRHYNASILNFDDLIGFPIPNGEQIQYLHTPQDVWQAEAVFVDEISRCRPDMQNRLFPLIHEKKLQGQRLEKLKYRWAAMNPPPTDDDPNSYFGAEPLDRAFADRFDWILPVPANLISEHRMRIIYGIEKDPNVGALLRAAILETKGRLHLVAQIYGEELTTTIDSLYVLLKRSGITLSFRRLRMIYKNCLGLLAVGSCEGAEDAIFRAVLYSLPQRTEEKVSKETVARAVQGAWKIRDLQQNDIKRRLLEETDPFARIAIALPSKQDDLVTATILDAYATISKSERLVLSSRLFPILVENFPEISAIVLETLAEDLAQINSLTHRAEHVLTRSQSYHLMQDIQKICSQLSEKQLWLQDVLWTCFQKKIALEPWKLTQKARRFERLLQDIEWREHA